MQPLPPRRPRTAWTMAIAAAALAVGLSGRLGDARAADARSDVLVLAPVRAVGMTLDTVLVGGYARGSFDDALAALSAELSPGERALVGGHLDRIFGSVLESGGLGRAGRLRLALVRALRPDGTTRSVRVLAAEAAAAGELHKAFYFERAGRPGYYDPFGRSLDAGAWTPPIPGARVSSPFGPRRMHPILRRALPHTGIDYAARAGTPVTAAGDGLVIAAGPRGGYGNAVEIQHPSGYSTRYAHLSWIAPGIRRGRVIRQGEMLGRVGMTGLATGPHLHYEVRRDGRPLDPARVAVSGGVAGDARADVGWRAQRERLARLLAGAPTLARTR